MRYTTSTTKDEHPVTIQVPSLKLDWEVPAQELAGRSPDMGDIAMSVAIAIRNEATRLVNEFTPDLEQSFPFGQNFHFHAHHDSRGWFGLRLVFIPGLSMMVGPLMEPADVATLRQAVASFK